MAWKKTASYGGSGGSAFADNLTEVAQLVGFNINSGSYIDGIQPVFKNCAGTEFAGSWHGGTGGTRSEVRFKAGEVLTTVNGRSGSYIDQLTFVTNVKSYSFGGGGGSPFSLPVTKGIGGFYGKSGKYIDNIGFFEVCS